MLLFAVYRERAGTGRLEVELPQGARLEELLSEVRRRVPRLAPASATIVAAINQEYAAPDTPLHDGDEVALIPPVSGGSPMVELTDRPLDPEAITARVRKDIYGGVVTFLGTTRLYTEGKQVLYLEYEAYPDMARKEMEKICRELVERWGPLDVAIAHRVGRLEIGEISLVVAVAAPHRKEAFQACQYVVDRIKQKVPIWKREVFQDGSVWVGSEGLEHGVTAGDW